MKDIIAGLLSVQVNGMVFNLEGDFTLNLGKPMRTPLLGTDGKVHGMKEEPKSPFIQGSVRNMGDLSVSDLVQITNATVTTTCSNGKTYLFRKAAYTGTGDIGTGDATVDFKMDAFTADEILA